MSNRKVGIGIIGAGRIGKVHAENLTSRVPGAHIVAITDMHRQAAEEAAKRFGIEKVADRAEDLFADSAVDAIFICSGTSTHPGFIIQAAAGGKHIFCEKPIAYTLPEIDRALDAVRQAGVKLQIGFNRRFDANFARVRKAIVENTIGRPSRLHIISRDPAPPSADYVRGSGGIFVDMTIHDFDMARFLMGEEPDEIYARGSVMTEPEIGAAGDFDNAVTFLRFKSGAAAIIDNSRRASYGYDQRVEAFGSKGKIQAENCYPNQTIISDGQSVHRDLPLNFFMDRYTESFAEEVREFVAAIQEQRPTPVTGEDGRAAVMLALAARRSADEQQPIKLAEFSQLESQDQPVS